MVEEESGEDQHISTLRSRDVPAAGIASFTTLGLTDQLVQEDADLFDLGRSSSLLPVQLGSGEARLADD